ncbi:MAG TPA: phosphoribosylglycinamide formyltransferase [Acidimicrobiales bacterium]|nr:phosphoribosylglycinamide formyltransferase [Acidimicrobiales bacterium]
MGVGVLVSGSGTILEALLAEHVPVDVVIADRPCRALQVAADAGVPAELLHRTDFSKSFDRDAYSDAVVDMLRKYDVDLVAIAGFGTVIPKAARDMPGRIINTHPALLPAFKGWHAVRDALAFGVKVTGCTVHVVTEEMDEGPILDQIAVRVEPDDTEETLHERIKEVERVLFPITIKRYLEELSR